MQLHRSRPEPRLSTFERCWLSGATGLAQRTGDTRDLFALRSPGSVSPLCPTCAPVKANGAARKARERDKRATETDCVAGHVGLEVRRESGKEQVVQVHYDEGVGAARLTAILAGESPASRDAMGRAARTMAPSSLQRINGAPHATAERFEQIRRNSRTRCNTDRRDRDGSVELARRRYRAWRRAPAVEKARGRRKRITEVAASMARGSGAGRTQDQTHRCRFRGRP